MSFAAPAVLARRARPAVLATRFASTAAVLVVLAGLTATTVGAAAPPARVRARTATESTTVRRDCPWAAAEAPPTATPAQLAAELLARMTLTNKLGLIMLGAGGGYENRTVAVPSLCLPSLTLQDGPDGLGYSDTGVTQLPASIGLAATFDPSLAYLYGTVLGSEARRQGIDAVQGPNLNLARVPSSGRIFEGFGEDPFLASAMGVDDIEGIQSENVMADVKHLGAYTQETDRLRINQVVSQRALDEVYLAPFRAAVERADVASVMCSYGYLNGVNTCEDASLLRTLFRSWGFNGFVRSDLNSVGNPIRAFDAGLDVLKPATVPELRRFVSDGELSTTTVNSAVLHVLTQMFAYHLIGKPPSGAPHRRVTTPAHARVALEVAERSMVLLKDRLHVLPLSPTATVALIGADASTLARAAGEGGAYVVPPFSITPLEALARSIGTRRVTYASGGSTLGAYPAIPPGELSSFSYAPNGVDGNRALPERLKAVLHSPAVDGTGSFPARVVPELATENEVFTPKATGTFSFSLTTSGNTWLYLNGRLLMKSVGTHGPSTWSTAVDLTAFHRYALRIVFGPQAVGLVTIPGQRPKAATSAIKVPRVGVQFDGDLIARAVAEARGARVAVVFADDVSSEAVDRPSLSLPGDENDLIAAVAAVNPRTVVVLNTGGAVLMPWLSKVAAVVEAWYPGEENGAATAAMLLGRVDPSGHLPLTFPASTAATPTRSASAWPGANGVVTLSDGLDVGYRWYEAKHVHPLFPFGYGLSYTSFLLSAMTVAPTADGYRVTVDVENSGRRSGTASVQAYLAFPSSAGEPPEELVAVGSASLPAGGSGLVTLTVPSSAFDTYATGRPLPVAGSYRLSVGQSSVDLELGANVVAPPVSPPASPATATAQPAG